MIARQRFITREAPRLPLAACTSASCNCSYRHYADRRQGPRRAEEVGLPDPAFTGTQRRRTKGRRTSDFGYEESLGLEDAESYFDYARQRRR